MGLRIDRFGQSIARIGDLDGDGVIDIAMRAFEKDNGGSNRGVVYILFLNADGTLKRHKKICDTEYGLDVVLDNSTLFGTSAAEVGDLDGDGVVDIAVAAFGDSDSGSIGGAMWILFLNSDGTVKDYVSSTHGGFTGVFSYHVRFGGLVAGVGDVDGDGVVDMAVGDCGYDTDGSPAGAVYILFLNADGIMKGRRKMTDTEGDFENVQNNDERLRFSLDAAGALDEDGAFGIVVGASLDDDGGNERGVVKISFGQKEDIPMVEAAKEQLQLRPEANFRVLHDLFP